MYTVEQEIKEQLTRAFMGIGCSNAEERREAAKDAIRRALEHSYGLDYENNKNFPPVYTAIDNDNKEALEELIKAGCTLDKYQGDQSSSPLIDACFANPEITKIVFEALVEKERSGEIKPGWVETRCNVSGHSALDHFCTKKETFELLKRSAQRGAVLDECCLFAAVYGQQAEIAQYLIDQGVDPDKRPDINKDRDVMLSFAILQRDNPCVDVLINAGANWKFVDPITQENLLFKAASHNSPAVVEKLVNLGLEVNSKNKEGETPLHEACKSTAVANQDTIKALVHLGADINLRADDFGNRTPLMIASAALNTDAMKALLESGADVDAVNKWGWNAMKFAKDTASFTDIHGKNQVNLDPKADETIAILNRWTLMKAEKQMLTDLMGNKGQEQSMVRKPRSL